MVDLDDSRYQLGETVALYCALWPDDPDGDEGPVGPLHPESVEADLTNARSSGLVARILTLLATDDGREWMLDEAIKAAGSAGETTAAATAELASETVRATP
jgi:hypothetical protein